MRAPKQLLAVALLGATFLSALPEAEAYSGWRRGRRGKLMNKHLGGQAQNAIDKYQWSISWRGDDATATTWAEAGGDTGADLTRSTGAPPTLGVSTSGLNSAGLPADLVDQAVGFNTATGGGYTSGSYAWGATDIVHVRLLLYDDGTSTAGDRFVRALVAGTNYSDVYYNSSSSYIQLIRNTTSYSRTTVHGQTLPGWCLIDSIYERTGGPTSLGQWTLYVNGSEFVATESTVAEMVSGNATFGVAGTHTGGNTPDADIVFVGYRWDPAFLTLDEHRADAALLGLYTPPNIDGNPFLVKVPPRL